MTRGALAFRFWLVPCFLRRPVPTTHPLNAVTDPKNASSDDPRRVCTRALCPPSPSEVPTRKVSGGKHRWRVLCTLAQVCYDHGSHTTVLFPLFPQRWVGRASPPGTTSHMFIIVCRKACHFFYMSNFTTMKSSRRFRSSSSRSSRRRAMTPSDVAELKKYRQRQLLEKFRALGPMPTTGTSRPMLTTAQMMRFNVFQDAKPTRRSNKKGKRTRS